MENISNIIGYCIELFYSGIRSDTLSVDQNGVIKDKHYNKNQDRSILITSTHSYKLAKEHNIELTYGDLGENILVDFNPYHLKPGTRLQIKDVMLEITQMSTLCRSLTCLNSKLPKLLKDDRGIFAKVIHPGEIKEGDSVIIL